MSQLTAAEKLFGTTTLTEQKAKMAKQTYAFLSISLVMAVLGGFLASSPSSPLSLPILNLFGTWLGWILVFVVINAVPYLALWASKRSKPLAVFALAVDGFLSGLALGPLLEHATSLINTKRWAGEEIPNLVLLAAGITGAIFVAITGYIFLARKRFSAPRGLLVGLFASLIAAIAINFLIGSAFSGLGLAISIGIGLLGTLMLIYATSDVLFDPNLSNPIQGALMLFAALFNIFVAVLRILLRIFSGGRR